MYTVKMKSIPTSGMKRIYMNPACLHIKPLRDDQEEIEWKTKTYNELIVATLASQWREI